MPPCVLRLRPVLAVAALIWILGPVWVTAAETWPPEDQNVSLADYLKFPGIYEGADIAEAAANHDLLVLHEWSAPKLAAIREANPNIRVLVYKNLGISLAADPAESVAGYDEVKQYDFAFCHDPNAEHIRYSYTSGDDDYVLPNPGVRAFQDFFASRCIQTCLEQGWDGVFIDDLWTYRGVYGTPLPVEYPTDSAWQEAMAEFLERVHSRLQDEGLLLGGNIGWWFWPTGSGGRAGRLYLEHLDLGMQEKFVVNYGYYWGSGYEWWEKVTQLLDDHEATGTMIWAYSRGERTDLDQMLYALGSYLLITGPGVFFQFQDPANTSERRPPYFTAYDIAEALGEPMSEARWHTGYSCGYRRFQNGYVVVNPNTSWKKIPELVGFYDIDGVEVPQSGAVMAPYSTMLFFYHYDVVMDILNGGSGSSSGGGVAPEIF